MKTPTGTGRGIREIRELMKPMEQFGPGAIEHTAFAATDNAAFMAEDVPNLIMLQDDRST